jgi:hypothetical protein
MAKLILVLLLLTAASCGCGSSTEEETASNFASGAIEDYTWLVGTWKLERGQNVSFERWSRESDSSLSGYSFRLDGADTIVAEKLRLLTTDSGLFYVADVAHNEQAVYFRCTESGSDLSRFENLEHDFPNAIIYRRIGSDSLIARIEGLDSATWRGMDFEFERVR